jgi:UDP-N-acetylmuramoyl-L-alanyl-D-glutamate--2,6-diaminopimelate ligase
LRLAALSDDRIRLTGPGEVEIEGVTADSREVRKGYLFAALPGARTDGGRFLADAFARGAAAVLAGPGLELPAGVPALVAEEPRAALARIAARFFGPQPRTVAAVTGTAGKTSVAVFTRQLWRALGRSAASIGTLGLQTSDVHGEGSLTTPDAVTLQRLAAGLARDGIDHLAIEASSHGLDQHRVDGLVLDAAAFTNLSRDHYDYHGSPEAYFAAKRRLFAELLPQGAAAVLNADVPEFPDLAGLARTRGHELLDYGAAARALRLVRRAPTAGGQAIEIEALGRRHAFESRLVGAFQAHNLLATLGLVLGCGEDPVEAVLPHLAGLVPPPGRMQLTAWHAGGAPAFVDYAHKPEALLKALEALRPHTAGRLVVVFGCGGDRDAGKRPIMGEIASRLADSVVVTDDNPRSEDPALIRRAILAAAPRAREVGDREEAIRAAFLDLGPGDTLLVAGKGHENYQIVGDRTLPFDDAEVLRAVARESGGRIA